MEVISRLKAEAEAIGLKGEEIISYIRDEQKNEREERMREREIEKERKAREDSLERRKIEISHAEEMARIRASNSSATATVENTSARKPSLPEYKDGEDIATFLIRFERVAELLNIPQGQYAVRLGSNLTGRAAEIYTSLDSETTKTYNSLKQALLQGFSKTPDKYRLDFRNAKLQPGENYSLLIIGLMLLEHQLNMHL